MAREAQGYPCYQRDMMMMMMMCQSEDRFILFYRLEYSDKKNFMSCMIVA